MIIVSPNSMFSYANVGCLTRFSNWVHNEVIILGMHADVYWGWSKTCS